MQEPDFEEHLIALPVAEAGAHMIIREHFQSRNWWMFIGFESEDRIRETFTEIEKLPGVISEKFEWPIVRVGKITGRSEDNILLLFVRKNSLDKKRIKKIVNKHGGHLSEEQISGDLDFFPMTVFGYANALTNAFGSILKQNLQADN